MPRDCTAVSYVCEMNSPSVGTDPIIPISMNVYEFGKYTSSILPITKLPGIANRVYNTSGALGAAQFAAGAASPLAPVFYTAAALYGAKQIYDAFA